MVLHASLKRDKSYDDRTQISTSSIKYRSPHPHLTYPRLCLSFFLYVYFLTEIQLKEPCPADNIRGLACANRRLYLLVVPPAAMKRASKRAEQDRSSSIARTVRHVLWAALRTSIGYIGVSHVISRGDKLHLAHFKRHILFDLLASRRTSYGRSCCWSRE